MLFDDGHPSLALSEHDIAQTIDAIDNGVKAVS